jgi:hypothetical protein
MHLILHRDIDDGISAVGRITHSGHEICRTMERPWVPHSTFRAGTPFESCIPPGLYGLERYKSEKYGDVYAIENTELGVFSHRAQRDEHGQEGDRYECLIHPGNWAYQLAGCIAPGVGRTEWQNTYMVTRSREALANLIDLLNRHDVNTLEIRRA